MKLKKIKEAAVNAKPITVSGELVGFFFDTGDYTALLKAIYTEQDEENE